jgi:hypothetical protein
MILLENSLLAEHTLSTAYWVCFGITIASALVSLGFSIAALRAPSGGIYARYAASRSAGLVVGIAVAVTIGSPAAVFVVAIVMTVVQAGDAVIGILDRDRMKTIGPAVFAVLNLAAAIWLAAR